jgi:phosphoglycerate kinase
MPGDFLTTRDFDLTGKRVLLRVDINSPLDPISGEILGDTRIRLHSDTIRQLGNCKLIVMAHQSRPGKADFTSLRNHGHRISQYIGKPVKFVDALYSTRAREAILSLSDGDVLLLENTRMYSEEITMRNAAITKQAGSHIVKNLVPLIDYFINDAFAAAHRSQPSLTGYTTTVPSLAGPIMEREIETLNKALKAGKRPRIVILGGAKVDDSIRVAENMLDNKIADRILTTGLVGNMFMLGKGIKLGKDSKNFLKHELNDYKKHIAKVEKLWEWYEDKIEIPVDVAVNNNGQRLGRAVSKLPSKHQIADIGLDTIVIYNEFINEAKTIILNGPAGIFEMEEFSFGTVELFKAIAKADAFTVAGGGETAQILNSLDIRENISHVSTGGGACIEYLAGEPLPVIEALKNSKVLYDKGEFAKAKVESRKRELFDYMPIYEVDEECEEDDEVKDCIYEMDENESN